MFHRQFGRHIRGAPRQGHARATVAIVLNEHLPVELLCFEHEARVAVRTETDSRPDDAVPGGLDKRQAHRRP